MVLFLAIIAGSGQVLSGAGDVRPHFVQTHCCLPLRVLSEIGTQRLVCVELPIGYRIE